MRLWFENFRFGTIDFFHPLLLLVVSGFFMNFKIIFVYLRIPECYSKYQCFFFSYIAKNVIWRCNLKASNEKTQSHLPIKSFWKSLFIHIEKDMFRVHFSSSVLKLG